MQEYSELDPTEVLSKSIPAMQKALDTVASGFSGTAFPTENLFVGMRCVRTDLNTEYICTALDGDNATWTDVANLTLHAGQAETDGDGNVITKTYLKTEDAKDTYLSKSEASGTYLSKNDASKTYFTKEKGDALAEDVTSNVEAVKNLQDKVDTTISPSIEDINSDISDINGKLDTNTNMGNKITVTKSTQAANSPSISIDLDGVTFNDNGNESKGQKASRNQILKVTIPTTVTGIAAGTYTLKNLLQQLVNKSHTHSTKTVSVRTNCNCNCNCDNTC